MDPFMFLQFSFKKDAVPGLRIETRTSHRYRSKVRYRTATDYGPSICIRVRILYRTVRIRILILHWRIKVKLLGARIRVQYSDPDLHGLVRIIRASHSNDMRCPLWRGQSRKMTTRPKSGLKIKICLKSKFLPPQVHIESKSANCGSGTRIRT
jgi:hypothetical protein